MESSNLRLVEEIKALRRSEERYRFLVDNLQDLICLMDKEGLFQYVSPSYQDELGFAPEDLLGKSAFTWVHADDLEPVRERFQSLIKTGITQEVSYRFQSATGEYLWFQSRGKPVRDSQGELIGVVFSNRNINLRKKMEESLRVSEERYRSLVEHAPAFITINDREGRMLFINRVLPEYDLNQVYQSTTYDHILPEYHDQVRSAFQKVFSEGIPQTYPLQGRRPDGEIVWYQTNLGPIWEGKTVVAATQVAIDITPLKKAEATLREREERLRLLLEGTDEGLWDWDVVKGEIKLDDNWIRVLGYVPGERVFDFSWWESGLHPDSRPVFEQSLTAYLEGRTKYYEIEYRMRSKSGEWRWIWARGVCVTYDPEGRPLRLIGTHRDITERKAVETDLQQRERELTLFTGNMIDMISYIDRDRIIRYMSPSIRLILGYEPEEMIGQTALELVHPDDRERLLQEAGRALAENAQTLKLEYRYRRVVGDYLWLESLCRFMRDDQGQLQGTVFSTRDITQRKSLEQALKESRDELEARVEERTAELEAVNENLQREILKRIQAQEEAVLKTEELKKSQARLQSVFDGITDPLVMLDQDLRVIMLNRAAQAYFGKNNIQEVIERPCFETFGDNGSLCPDGQIEQAVSSGVPFQYERSGLMDTNRWENLMLYPLREAEEGIKGVILRIADTTEKKLAENQLIQRQKMEALGILISGIAHEINNPNNFISFNMPILRDYLSALLSLTDATAQAHPELFFFGMTYPEFREDVFRLLENVRNGSDRINAIVSQLKTFSRKKGGLEIRETDIRDVVDRVVTLSKNQLKKTVHSLEIDLADNLPPVRTDPEALGQVLLNLLINGAQAADKPDSWIKVTVDQRPDFPKLLIIEVADNGCGMDDEILGRIFNPFFTTKKVGEGTGLGLYVCQNLVENLGGWIEVQSQSGIGSRFQVFLPVQ
jgi:PAS domain S-box-containing protein